MTTYIAFETQDLASRSLAAEKRSLVENAFQSKSCVMFDFKEVQSISASYADELFGVLCLKYGSEAVTKSVRLQNCNNFCAQQVAEAIIRRAKRHLAA